MDAPTTMYLLKPNGYSDGYGYGDGDGSSGDGDGDPLTPEHVICLLAARRLTCTC